MFYLTAPFSSRCPAEQFSQEQWSFGIGRYQLSCSGSGRTRASTLSWTTRTVMPSRQRHPSICYNVIATCTVTCRKVHRYDSSWLVLAGSFWWRTRWQRRLHSALLSAARPTSPKYVIVMPILLIGVLSVQYSYSNEYFISAAYSAPSVPKILIDVQRHDGGYGDGARLGSGANAQINVTSKFNEYKSWFNNLEKYNLHNWPIKWQILMLMT